MLFFNTRWKSHDLFVHLYYIHTYIHNWSLQPFSQDYWLSFSHHLCLYVSGGTYSLKSTSNDRFVWKTLRVFARNLLRGNAEVTFFCILFWCLAWDSNPGFSCNKPAHYLLDQGDLYRTDVKLKDDADFLHLSLDRELKNSVLAIDACTKVLVNNEISI